MQIVAVLYLLRSRNKLINYWLRNNYVKSNTFIEKGKKSQNKKKHKHNQEKTGFELKLEINLE